MRSLRSTRLQRVSTAAALLSLAILPGLRAGAQASSDSGPESQVPGRGRIILVLPFDNRSGQPNLEWIREAASELLSRRLVSAGFLPLSRDQRRYALDHLGLPEGFQPSRASALKLAQTLDADSIIVGSYVIDGANIVAEARVVDVPHLAMSEAVSSRGDLHDLIAVFDSLSWKLTRILDPHFGVAEETFVAAGKEIRLDAFEQYVRGITEPDHDERLRHLKQAVLLSPEFGPGWMALGGEDYAGQQYDDAAAAFAKVGRNEPDFLEAGFYRGLSLLFSANYPQAEAAFEAVAKVLPLPEVLNNEGVAISRQGHDGSAMFVAAESADPNSADYHFNLAVSLKHRGSNKEALGELMQCLKLRPGDTEAQEVEREWSGAPAPPPSGGDDQSAAPDTKADPLERIVRTFDAAAFRQAAAMMDQIEAARLAALAPHERAQHLTELARGYLNRGLLLEAERLFQASVAADGSLPEAHAGLAEVRERTGDAATARAEAKAALALRPSADAYLVLGRLDLAANRLEEAGQEASGALKLDPGNRAAQDLSQKIEARTGRRP